MVIRCGHCQETNQITLSLCQRKDSHQELVKMYRCDCYCCETLIMLVVTIAFLPFTVHILHSVCLAF